MTVSTPRSESLPQINFPSGKKAWNFLSILLQIVLLLWSRMAYSVWGTMLSSKGMQGSDFVAQGSHNVRDGVTCNSEDWQRRRRWRGMRVSTEDSECQRRCFTLTPQIMVIERKGGFTKTILGGMSSIKCEPGSQNISRASIQSWGVQVEIWEKGMKKEGYQVLVMENKGNRRCKNDTDKG